MIYYNNGLLFGVKNEFWEFIEEKLILLIEGSLFEKVNICLDLIIWRFGKREVTMMIIKEKL